MEAMGMQTMRWPSHLTLTLSHNDHKNVYHTVAQAIEADDHGYQDDCWISAEHRAKAIETNECWTLQWYPETPIGFYIKSAADLAGLLESLAGNQETAEERLYGKDVCG